MQLLETIKHYVHTACLSVLLILIGVAVLWAVGAYYQVEVPKMHDGEASSRMRVALTENNYIRSIDASGEEWHPITKEVDLHVKALRTLAELERLVKAQTLTIEQARAEYSEFLKARKP